VCKHENSVDPDTCECLDGYSMNSCNEMCVPVCLGDCKNCSCVRANVCKCFEDYSMDPISGRCMPECPGSCDSGRCSASRTCSCNDRQIDVNCATQLSGRSFCKRENTHHYI
jgi:hypothetical protein